MSQVTAGAAPAFGRTYRAYALGLGLGPLVTGALSDILAVSMGLGEGLRWALIIVTLANVWCVIHYLLGARTLRADLLSRPDA